MQYGRISGCKSCDTLRRILYFIKYKHVNNLAHADSGKSFLAAFDILNFNPKRLLYIVHEGSILMKSVETFSRVFGADKTYGIYNAEYKNFDSDFVFSTNVTMAN